MKKLLHFARALVYTVIFCGLTLNTYAQIQKGADLDGEAADDWSGRSVSMPDPNTLAIGADMNDGNGSNSGQVRIYSWNGSSWIQKGTDIDGEAVDDKSGFSLCMPDNSTIVIGAPENDANGNNSGHVRIFKWDGTAWVQKGSDLDGEAAGDLFGWSVSMPDTNTVAIGAMYNDGNGIDAGHVRIYTWNGTSWVQLGTDIDGGTANDFFGSSVSMPDVNTVAIGSPQDYLNNYAGYARICTWNGTSWVQKGSDIYGTSPGDNSGWSISMPDPNTVAIGARYNDGNGSASGQVRIYSWNGSVWLQKGFDIYGEAAGDRAGWFVYMPDANTVAIGAPNNDGNGTDAGQVRIYSWSGNAWVQQGLDIDGEVANDFSGMSLSMPDANTIAIGAPRNDGTGSNAGHVRVYSGIVGIEQNDFGNSLAIYPNPTHGNLSLDLENTYTNVVVIVRNELGQEVYNYTFGTTSKLEFTIPGEAGIYFVELNADNKRAMLKAIKK